MSKTIRPLRDRILLSREEEKEQIRGGIIIPDTAKEKPQRATVVAVGDGKVLDNGSRLQLNVKVGDTVLFGKYSGTEIKLDGKEFIIMKEEEVLGILENTEHAATA